MGHFLGGIAQYHAAAEVNDGAFGRSQHLYGFFNLADVTLYNRLVGADKDVFLWIAEFGHRLSNIFRNIDDNGARTAAGGNLEGFFNRISQLANIGNQEVVFDTRAGNADRIHFLERICTDEGIAHLAADDDQGDGIAVRGSNAGQCVGYARAGSYQGHADFAADAGIGICRMYGCLLMAGQNVLEFVELENGIVDFDNRTTGIAEYVFNTFGFETLHDDLCA